MSGSIVEVVKTAVDTAGKRWVPPHVVEEAGETSLEWWKGSRSLGVFAQGDTILDVVKMAGPHEMRDMSFAGSPSLADVVAAYAWLIGDE